MGFAGLPIVGDWYQRADRPQAFQVVAVDEDHGTVDIEYFDGTVDEWPLTHWHALEIEPCEAPQDWTGAFDDIERDDLGASETDMSPEDWREPLEGPQEPATRRMLEGEAGEVRPVMVRHNNRRGHRAHRARPRHRPPEE